MNSLTIAKKVLAGALFVPEEKISDDTLIDDLAVLDSLSFETLVLELEEETGYEIDPVDLLLIRTVRDLAAIIDTLK